MHGYVSIAAREGEASPETFLIKIFARDSTGDRGFSGPN